MSNVFLILIVVSIFIYLFMSNKKQNKVVSGNQELLTGLSFYNEKTSDKVNEINVLIPDKDIDDIITMIEIKINSIFDRQMFYDFFGTKVIPDVSFEELMSLYKLNNNKYSELKRTKTDIQIIKVYYTYMWIYSADKIPIEDFINQVDNCVVQNTNLVEITRSIEKIFSH